MKPSYVRSEDKLLLFSTMKKCKWETTTHYNDEIVNNKQVNLFMAVNIYKIYNEFLTSTHSIMDSNIYICKHIDYLASNLELSGISYTTPRFVMERAIPSMICLIKRLSGANGGIPMRWPLT